MQAQGSRASLGFLAATHLQGRGLAGYLRSFATFRLGTMISLKMGT